MQNWKKTGAALIVATLTVSGAGYAWANSDYDTVDLNDIQKNTQETTTTETAHVTPTQTVAATTAPATTTTGQDIPVELATEKLVGLMQAYETASNDEAKAAILNVINRVIAEYETTQKEIYQKKAPKLTAAIDRLIVLFKAYQQAPSADAKAAIIAQVKVVVTELQNYLNKKEEPKENTPPVIVPPIKDKDKGNPSDKNKADRDKKKAELEKKKAEDKAAREAAKAAAEAKRAQEKAATEAKRAQEKAAAEAKRAQEKEAREAEKAAKKAAQEQNKAKKQPKHPNNKNDNRHNQGPKNHEKKQPKHEQHKKHEHPNKNDHKKGQHPQGKNDRN